MDPFCAQQGSVGDSFLVEGQGSSQWASVSVFAMPESWADVMHGRSPIMHMSMPEITLGGDSREQSRRPLLHKDRFAVRVRLFGDARSRALVADLAP